MLTRNYVAIADRTQRPFGTTKSVRSQRSWAWDYQQPSAVKVTTFDEDGKASVRWAKAKPSFERQERSPLDLRGPARIEPKARLCKRWAAL